MGTDSVGEVEVSTGTPCVAAEVASVANSVPPKKPFHVCAHGNGDQEKKRVEEIRMEEGVTTKEEPSFTA